MRSVIVHLVIETLSLMNHYVLSTIKTVIIVFVTRGGSGIISGPELPFVKKGFLKGIIRQRAQEQSN